MYRGVVEQSGKECCGTGWDLAVEWTDHAGRTSVQHIT